MTARGCGGDGAGPSAVAVGLGGVRWLVCGSTAFGLGLSPRWETRCEGCGVAVDALGLSSAPRSRLLLWPPPLVEPLSGLGAEGNFSFGLVTGGMAPGVCGPAQKTRPIDGQKVRELVASRAPNPKNYVQHTTAMSSHLSSCPPTAPSNSPVAAPFSARQAPAARASIL